MNLFFKELQLVNTIEGAIKELEKQIDISPKLNEIIDFITKNSLSFAEGLVKLTSYEIDFKEDVKFNRMFSEKLSQKITKLYWEKVTENSKICFLPTSEPKQILEQIAIKFPKSKPFKKLQMVT